MTLRLRRATPRSRRRRVLLLLTAGSLRTQICEALVASGHAASVTETLAETLDHLDEEGRPDLLIVDLDSPRLSGREVLERLAAEPRARRVRALALMGSPDARRVPPDLAALGVRVVDSRFASPGRLLVHVNALLFCGGRECRRHPRVAASVPVRLSVEGCSSFGVTRDVSLSGAFIPCATPLPLGTEVELLLSLPASAEPVRARGRVVRTEGALGPVPAGMGLELLRLRPEDAVLLADFVSSQVSSAP